MVEQVQSALKAGRSAEEIVKAPAVKGFESWEGTPTALRATYDELTAKS